MVVKPLILMSIPRSPYSNMAQICLRANRNLVKQLFVPFMSRCLTQMEEEGFSLDDVFRKGVFRQDERDMVLKAVQIVQPDYQPSLKTDTEQCSSSLVHNYYTQVNVAQAVFDMYHVLSCCDTVQ